VQGRVLAIDGRVAIVRGADEDVRIADAPREWKPGDLVDGDRVVRAFAGDYPPPGSEVARLTRDRLHALRDRATALATLRAFFAERGFLEVETPLIVPSPGLEIHLDAVAAGDGFLITSPEYSMKRLLAAGAGAIYQVCKCFRAREDGPHHASEFTMIEWYRPFAGIAAIARDTEELVHAVCGDVAHVGDREVDVKPPWRRISVRDAMRTWAGVELRGDEPAEQLAAAIARAGIAIAPELAWDDAFFTAWLARVEPAIAALDHAIFVEDWPAPLAALARRKPDDPAIALRFEAYIGGIELANAFDELVDPDEQRVRFVTEQQTRASRDRPVYPLDERLLAALAEGLPPSAGIALGFDRLVMLATGVATIGDVQTFAQHER
jgi:lysyl-tRNA synthetase class 2